MATPCVYLVGAGPGDPELLTVKALRLLQEADVVVFDRLVSDEILALIPAGTTRIYAGKALNRHEMPQAQINELLINLGRTGRKVVRLKGGDPFVFGRGSEEAEQLAQNGIAFEVVPGITAASGCASYAGIPLTHRGLATGVRYITGHFRDNQDLGHDWAKLADPDMTLVFYMGLYNIEIITRELIQAGLPADIPAAAVERGTSARQREVLATAATLPERVREAGLGAPTTIIIGRVVSLAERLRWFHPLEAGSDTEDAGVTVPEKTAGDTTGGTESRQDQAC